ncbi:hypothetical protein O0555_21090 [Brevibacillus laterosporus]|uniref:hypothetical protein n=1 Tax=Brevibacillus laterosporus TaxID=1465 RepID=UPI00215CAC2C|nr:hypothetical protein [Brevibacillus laterosporus]MCR8939799.1 hypothetical protein [Brevibacillus laterosporus]MCZ0842439.1 hypothetical protein [Brevibacillus laterosporus]MCZ0846436.1 hypothetical protein [Brevibacillus laterosporus]
MRVPDFPEYVEQTESFGQRRLGPTAFDEPAELMETRIGLVIESLEDITEEVRGVHETARDRTPSENKELVKNELRRVLVWLDAW